MRVALPGVKVMRTVRDIGLLGGRSQVRRRQPIAIERAWTHRRPGVLHLASWRKRPLLPAARRRGMLMGMAKPVQVGEPADARRRWFQFSLKWLFVLVPSLPYRASGWRQRWSGRRPRTAAVAEIKKQGGVVFMDADWKERKQPSGLSGCESLLGDDFSTRQRM